MCVNSLQVSECWLLLKWHLVARELVPPVSVLGTTCLAVLLLSLALDAPEHHMVWSCWYLESQSPVSPKSLGPYIKLYPENCLEDSPPPKKRQFDYVQMFLRGPTHGVPSSVIRGQLWQCLEKHAKLDINHIQYVQSMHSSSLSFWFFQPNLHIFLLT